MGCPVIRDKNKMEDDDTSVKKHKVLLIGLDGSGKTTIVNQLKSKSFVHTVPTIGVNIESISYKNLDFLVFDVGGKITSLWSHYYENTDALIFVVDSLDSERFPQVKEEFVKLNQELKFTKTVILVLFNKFDLSEVPDISDLVDYTAVNEIFDSNIIVQKCSAKTGNGVFEGFDKLISYLNVEDRGKMTFHNGSTQTEGIMTNINKK
jgi:small GTP-binding protein